MSQALIRCRPFFFSNLNVNLQYLEYLSLKPLNCFQNWYECKKLSTNKTLKKYFNPIDIFLNI